MIDINVIGVGVETKEVTTATRELDKFGKSADSASRKADGLGDASKRSAREVDTLKTSANGSIAILGRMALGLGAVASAGSLVRTIDEYTKFTAQLKLATRSQQEYTAALSDVNRIASTAQASLSSVGVLYARLNNSLRDLGVSQAEVAKVTENVGLALKVSGATAQESASAMLQLSQAFGSGVLRGEEFNAVNEAAPALMRALAESMGVPIGRLRELASEGQITSSVLVKAFGDERLLENYRQQAKEVNTISGAWQNLKNQVMLSVGAINQATGASNLFVESMKAASNFIGNGSPFQVFGLAARATQNRFNQAIGVGGSTRSGGNGNNLFGGASPITSGGNVSPNYAATIAVQDINKIHQAQEEAARKNKEIQDKYQDAITKRKLGEQELYWERESRLMEEKLDGIIKEDKIKAKLEKEDYEQKLKYMDLLQKQANANFDEAQKKVKELEEEAKKASDEIGRSLTDALLRGFERGKSFAENFKDTLINVFKTLILQPIIRFLIDSSGITKILAAFGGIFSGGAVAGEAGGGGGFGGILSSVKDLFSSGTGSIIGSIEGLGATIANGNGGLLDAIGGFIGENASAIADGFGYFGAALQLAQGNIGGALGTAVGTFFGGPIGGAIGSFLGGALGGLFGGGLPPRVTESRTGVLRNGQFTAYDAADPGKRKLGMASGLDQLNEVFANNINTLLQGFGLNQTISSSALLTQKKNVRARFSYGIGDAGGYGYEENFGKNASFQDAFNALVENALGQVTVKAIQASDLPDGVKQFFNGLTKKEDVAETINTLVGMKKALVDLPPIFNAVRNALDTSAYSTTIDQLKAQFQATQTFVELFYSDTEKFDIFTQQLIAQFDAMNQVIPTSREQYRALVESINVVDDATRDQFNALVSIAPAMNEYFNLLNQQADGINEVNQALADGLNQNLFSTFADYASARASVANGLTATGFMGELSVRRSQGDAELAGAVKSLVAQQARTDVILAEIADATRRTREINERWNGDGLPETRVM